jgi:phage baseplate assembly protein V
MTGHDDIPAAIGDSFRKGTIQSVDGNRAVVKCGEIVSPPLPWLTLAGGFSLFVAPTVGQQVGVLCPEGDIEGGVILNGLYSDAFPAPGDGLKIVLKMPDGTALQYDSDTHTLTMTLTASGKVAATADGGFTFTGKSKFVGDMEVTGKGTFSDKVSTAGDLSADGTVTLGSGASQFVKLADGSNATKVKAK